MNFRPDLEALGCRLVPADPLYLDPSLPPAVEVVAAPVAPQPVLSVLAGTWFEAIGAPYVRDPQTGAVISGGP